MIIKEYNFFKKIFKKKDIITNTSDPKEELTLFQALKLPEERLYNVYKKNLISLHDIPLDRVKRDITQKEYNRLKNKLKIIQSYIDDGKFSFYKGHFSEISESSSYHYDDGLIIKIYNSKQTTFPMWTIRGMNDNYYFATITTLRSQARSEVKEGYLCDTMDGFLQLLIDLRYGKAGQIWV